MVTCQVITAVDMSLLVNYSSHMIEVRKTATFTKWFKSLKDRRAKARIQVRIDRLEMGHFGDVEPVGTALVNYASSTDLATEFILFRKVLLWGILLSGGEKSSQQADIARAKEIARQLEV